MDKPTDGFITTADVGAMINHTRFDYLENVLETAVNHGATIDVGGRRWAHPYLEHGSYFSPTVVGDVDPKSHLAQAESAFRFLSSSSSFSFFFPPLLLSLPQICTDTGYG